MVHPVGADIHQVHRWILTQRLISLFGPTVALGRYTLIGQIIHAALRAVFLHVAHGRDMAAWHEGKPLHGTGPAHAQAHDAYADIGDGIGRKLQHVLLPDGPFRHRQLNHGRSFALAGNQQACRNKEP